jgi:VWFA-related protein
MFACRLAAQDNAPEMTQKDSPPTFSSKVNLVLVPVVVRDGQGHAVGNLTKDDFQLFDKGKAQAIASFQVIKRSGATAEAVKPDGTSPAVTAEAAAAVASPERYVAYLFDDLNAQPGDMMTVRKAAKEHLSKSLLASDRAAIYTTSGQTELDFTDDKAKLLATLEKVQAKPMLQHAGRQCPDISYYMADLMVNKNDQDALNVATQETLACTGMDPSGGTSAAKQQALATAQQELAVGEQDTRVTLSVVKAIIRRLASRPGQRLMVLASPGFLAVTAEAFHDKSEILDLAASMNVMISSLNSRGLFTTNLDASQQGAYSITNERIIEQYFRENAMATEDVLAELADGTGGLFYHNNNDLVAGFAQVATAPEVSYVLGFSPIGLKQDGSFHRLKISLLNRKDSVQARRGYYAVKRGGDLEADAKADIESAVFSRDELRDIPIDLQTQFFKPSADAAKLTIVAKMDLRHLRYRKTDGRNNDNLTVVSVLFDRNGNYITGMTKNLEMKLKDETLARLPSGITVKTNFDVKPGTYVVRLVVRDSEGQAMAAQNGAVEIP